MSPRRLLCLFVVSAFAFAETPVQHLLEGKMYARIQALDHSLAGVMGVAAIDLTNGRVFVLSVFSTFIDDNANPAGGAAKIVFEYFSKLANSNEYGHKLK